MRHWLLIRSLRRYCMSLGVIQSFGCAPQCDCIICFGREPHPYAGVILCEKHARKVFAQ